MTAREGNAPIQDSATATALLVSNEAAWHTQSVTAAAKQLRSELHNGLTSVEAAQRLARHGPNTLTSEHGRSVLIIFLAQFHSLMVLLLVAATVVSFAMEDHVEALAILVVILLNAGIGFLTEWKAEQALVSLQKQTVSVAHVIREGVERQIPAAQLVPGDLVVLAAGARVPADGRIVESVRLQMEEAALTGESQAVTKTSAPLLDKGAALGDRANMAFMGTTVTDGRGRMLVTATGASTEVGKIGVLLEEATERSTPLEQKLTRLGRLLIVVVLGVCAIIVLAGWARGVGDFWHMFEVGISLAIAAVPEGLPAVATITLALGMRRMATMGALIRRLPAVETLGATTVICTDKTGTLTKNEMTVRVLVLDERQINVTGTGYAPVGEFRDSGQNVAVSDEARLELALRIGALCNDAELVYTDGRYSALGDPTEAALVVAAEKAGLGHAPLERAWPRLAEIPFDSVKKRMSTIHRTPQGRAVAFVKGSPSTLLALSTFQERTDGLSPMMPTDRDRWESANRQLAAAALRVLGLAYRNLNDGYAEQELERDLIFVGLVGMSDPIRDEAKAAITTCRRAGIRTVMITGDQPSTAAAVAAQLAMSQDDRGQPLRTIHGRELAGLDATGWQRAVADTAVFARVSPEHKLHIVEALQQQGQVVAMTGDGVNDAPALKKADIGVAMGIKGTEVAKEAADMVITDDNFATIVQAVEQGRVIYANIQRFIHYLFSCNFSEILTVFIAILIGWPLPFEVLQILWLNMITDVFPALALAVEPSSPDVMRRFPRNPAEPILPPRFLGLVLWQGLLLSVATLVAFYFGLRMHGAEGKGLHEATTMAFMTLALTQILHTFNARSQRHSAFSRQLFVNRWLWAAVLICLLLQAAAIYVPVLRLVLRTVPPAAKDWVIISVCSLTPVAVVEMVKALQARVRGRHAQSPT